jgi:hypothetical protein
LYDFHRSVQLRDLTARVQVADEEATEEELHCALDACEDLSRSLVDAEERCKAAARELEEIAPGLSVISRGKTVSKADELTVEGVQDCLIRLICDLRGGHKWHRGVCETCGMDKADAALLSKRKD